MSNNISIRNIDPQEIIIEGVGTPSGITNVYVNGVDVTVGTKAYVIVPTKLSELTNDEGFITAAEETDPTVPYYVKEITLADINSWNDKQDLLVSGTNIKTINGSSILGSGNLLVGTEYTAGTGIDITGTTINNTITSYNDLTDLPTIPTNVSQLVNDSGFITNQVDDLVNYIPKEVIENMWPQVSDSGTELYLADTTNYNLNLRLNAHEIEQFTTTGKNLFDIQTLEKGRLDNGVINYAANTTDLTLYDNSFSFTTNATWRGVSTDFISVEESTDYVISSPELSSTTTLCACYDEYQTFISNATTVNLDSNSRKYTTPASCKYIRFSIQLSAAGTLTMTNPQVEQNSTATDYEPYTGGMASPNPLYPQTVYTLNGENTINVIGKNLFDKTAEPNNTNYYINNSGSLVYSTNYKVYKISLIQNSDYTLSGIKNQYSPSICFYDKNDTFLSGTNYNGNTSITVTTPNNTNYALVTVGIKISESSYNLDTFMIEAGTTATDYEEYKEQVYPVNLEFGGYNINFNKISKYVYEWKDRMFINKSTDPDYQSHIPEKYWLYKEQIYRFELANYANFTLDHDYGDYIAFECAAPDLPTGNIYFNYGISEYFNTNDPSENYNWIDIGGGNIYIVLDARIGISTAEDLNTWITNNNPIVYYVRWQPTYYIIDQYDLDEQLNNISKAQSYKGSTTVYQENDELPFELEAKTLKDLSNL